MLRSNGSWRAGALGLAGTVVLGAVVVWSPWRGEPLPPGVDLDGCDASQDVTLSLSASFSAGNSAQPPRVVLVSPAIPDDGAVAQDGSTLRFLLAECDGVGVALDLEPADRAAGGLAVSAEVESRRLRAGSASVHVNDPSQVPCGDGESCGAWTGWYFTIESGGEGSAVFSTPVRWGSAGGSLDLAGEVEVTVVVDEG